MQLTKEEMKLIYLALDWFEYKLLYGEAIGKGTESQVGLMNKIGNIKEKFKEGRQ